MVAGVKARGEEVKNAIRSEARSDRACSREGRLKGAPKAWRLTQRGEEVEDAIRSDGVAS
jgi:hypothetical protein